MRKNFVVDTSVLLEDPDCIKVLMNGQDNNIWIPYNVLLQLNKLKSDPKLSSLAISALNNILNNDKVKILELNKETRLPQKTPDLFVIKEIKQNLGKIENPIIVSTNPSMLIQSKANNITGQVYEKSKSFDDESNLYTGIVDLYEENQLYVPNCFYWKEGKVYYNSFEGEKLLDYDNSIWQITPKNIYQNMAMELLLDTNVLLTSIQSQAGLGKTFLALAAAFHFVLQKKQYEKIFITRATVEVDESLGFLPGDLEDKLKPYFEYLNDLIIKLHRIREVNRIFKDPKKIHEGYDPKKLQILPIQYLRGRNIDNAFVIIDEMQNMNRNSTRTILSRMGENVKVICLGDIRQIDDLYLNPLNNGLAWVISKLKGEKQYGHLTLKGKKSRGPITDMIIKRGL